MSLTELQRFMRDLRCSPEMLEEFSALERKLAVQVSWANAAGYAFTLEEAAGQDGGQLSDEELEQAAGGWSGELPPP